jgi:YebC/PmpR family DNA-binding regulatory protein
MAGHSKWANIKHKKAATDKKRGTEFTKLTKAIMTAVKVGGTDPTMNFKLRLAIDKAKAASMPNANIDRAIEKAGGEAGGANAEEILYEGYGPGGSAILVETLTDNKNRTVSEVRHTFSKNNGNLGESGSVAYLFDPRGSIYIEAGADAQEALLMEIMELPVLDIEQSEEGLDVLTEVAQLEAVKQGLADKNIAYKRAELVMHPKSVLPIADAQAARQLMGLLEALEDNEDVQEVYTNADIDAALLGDL